MTFVVAKEGESVESMLRRFKKRVEAAGILKEARKREYYLKPSVRKKIKRAAAKKQRLRAAARARGRSASERR